MWELYSLHNINTNELKIHVFQESDLLDTKMIYKIMDIIVWSIGSQTKNSNMREASHLALVN
jgi:hypothetical protein